MRYFRQWKEANAEFKEITYEEAFKALDGNYKTEGIPEMLKCEQTISCPFCIIEVKEK